jgi:outer membrane protein assembly factor BamB
VWWAFFSRAPWVERLGALLLMAAGVFATRRFLHPSIAGAGMGMLFYFLAIPVLSLALVAWAAAGRRLARGPRRSWLIATVLLACGSFTLLRTAGTSGSSPVNLHWRWTPTPEERLLAREASALASVPKSTATAAPERPVEASSPPAAATPAPPAIPSSDERSVARAGSVPQPAPAALVPKETGASWSGFRGPARDGVVRDVRIRTDWTTAPPVELWRRPIGPGWSSFAVQGDRLYTQEQRGEEEMVDRGRVARRHSATVACMRSAPLAS